MISWYRTIRNNWINKPTWSSQKVHKSCVQTHILFNFVFALLFARKELSLLLWTGSLTIKQQWGKYLSTGDVTLGLCIILGVLGLSLITIFKIMIVVAISKVRGWITKGNRHGCEIPEKTFGHGKRFAQNNHSLFKQTKLFLVVSYNRTFHFLLSLYRRLSFPTKLWLHGAQHHFCLTAL